MLPFKPVQGFISVLLCLLFQFCSAASNCLFPPGFILSLFVPGDSYRH